VDLEDLPKDPHEDDFIFEIGNEQDPFFIVLQFELVTIISPCIIWIPNIHDMRMTELNCLSRCLLVKYISVHCERSSTNLVIASANIPPTVELSLIALNRLNTCMKIRRLLIPQR